jgi:SWI/SNF-related matrix-associated actin-dependent regulator 1 of chromatin subfamily A
MLRNSMENLKQMNLLPHQQVAKDFLLTKRRCILADAPRVGKTLPSAHAAAQNLPALVVCPAVAKRVWERAFKTIGITATVVMGREMAAGMVTAGVVIVNYDLLQYMAAIKGWNTLILDESHRIKNHTAKRTKTALKLMKATSNVYCLSGTPIPNRPIEIWTALHGLGIYNGSWLSFAYRYAKAWQSPWGLDVSGASNLPELKDKMSPYVLRRKRDDVFTSYQQPVVSLIELDLPVSVREKKFDADALVENPNLILAFEGLAEILKEGGIRKIPMALEFIKDKLDDEPDEPLVVMCWHKDVAAMLEDGLSDYRVGVITGDTPAGKRNNLIDEFAAGKLDVMIGNIGAIGEGIDLSRSSTVIFVEATWATNSLEQAGSRVENINKSGASTIYILTIRNSLDHRVLSGVLKKMDVIDQIL